MTNTHFSVAELDEHLIHLYLVSSPINWKCRIKEFSYFKNEILGFHPNLYNT